MDDDTYGRGNIITVENVHVTMDIHHCKGFVAGRVVMA